MVLPLIGVVALGARLAAPFVVKKVVPFVGRTFFGSLTRASLTTTGIGILAALPTEKRVPAVKAVVTAPFRAGEAIGETIEAAPEGGIVETLGKAGIIGLGGVGAVIVGKKILEKIPKKGVISPLLATPPVPTVIDKPLTTGPAPPKKAADLLKPPVAMPSIKISNRPVINISFKKSRRFINQQVLVRA